LEDHAGHKVKFLYPKTGDRRRLLEMGERNAKEALAMKVSQKASQKKILEALTKELNLPKIPERIEVYDNSHIQGTDAYGCMVVAGPDGFDKKSYRQFIIKNAKQESLKQGGDDYSMMEEVLTRRFKGAEKDNHPDLIILDGGKGQLSISVRVMESLGLNHIPMVAIAKGPDRNAGRERFFMPDREEFSIDFQSPVMYYLQRLRDEAHRFAIGTHRAKRERKLEKSALDSIPGVGAKRKKALLQHFGSVRHVSESTVKDIMKVDGISRDLAQTILDYLR
jgi:excinuclease ABC subunit C